MREFIDEVDTNFDDFFNETQTNVSNAFEFLSDKKDEFKKSNRILISFQAWNSELLNRGNYNEAKGFFLEAQNDAIMSHTLARQGAWRVALMSLRSCVENTLYGIFYLEHPVELKLWRLGKHKLGFTEVKNYISNHPAFLNIPDKLSGLGKIGKEYATLSKAVHGSSNSFRVTQNGQVEGLNILSNEELNKWRSREIEVIKLLNMILLVFFREKLNGAALVNLRKAISLAIPETLFEEIKDELNVSLKKIR